MFRFFVVRIFFEQIKIASLFTFLIHCFETLATAVNLCNFFFYFGLKRMFASFDNSQRNESNKLKNHFLKNNTVYLYPMYLRFTQKDIFYCKKKKTILLPNLRQK